MVLIFLSILSLAITPRTYAEITLATGVRYDMFTDDRSPKTIGYELTFPLFVSYKRTLFVLSLSTAYSSANVYPGHDSDAGLSSMTDTRLSISYGNPNLPVGLIFGLDLNLPSGKERLNGTQKAAEAGENHDLFEVDDFGEGFNIDVSAGLAEDVGPVSLGINGKYRFNNEYDPTQNLDGDAFDPGEQILGTAFLKWDASSWLKIDTSVAYTHYTADKREGKERFQAGDKISFGGIIQMRYQISRPIRITAGFQQTFQARNKELGIEKLEIEPANSNGKDFFGLLDVLYDYSSRLALRVFGDIRYYDESERKDTEKGVPFDGRRVRYAFGPGFIYTPNSRFSVSGLAKYFVLNQERDILMDRATTFQGVNLSVELVYTF